MTSSGYADLAKAPNTLRAYGADRRDFSTWCKAHGIAARPAAIVNQTDHRSVTMVRKFTRERSLVRENAAAKVGLWAVQKP